VCLQDVNGSPREPRPRLCHLRKGPQGYGFNLHSDKSRPGQYIRSVDPGSPASHSGLRAQDRLIEVPCPLRLVCVHICVCVRPCICLCVGPGSLLEKGRRWELELALLLLPRLVVALMNI
jgi:hypothetical protein